MTKKTRTQASAPNGTDPSLAAEPSEQLHTRIPREMRDALRASAQRQGVSLSKVVEQWLTAGKHVYHGGDIPNGLPQEFQSLPGSPLGLMSPPSAILHPACYLFGKSNIEMEYDQARSVSKVTIEVRSSQAAREPDPGEDGRGQAQPGADEHD